MPPSLSITRTILSCSTWTAALQSTATLETIVGPSRIPPEAHCFALHLLCKKKEQEAVSSSGDRGLTTSRQCIEQQQQQRQWYWSQLDTDKYCNLYPPLSQLHGPIPQGWCCCCCCGVPFVCVASSIEGTFASTAGRRRASTHLPLGAGSVPATDCCSATSGHHNFQQVLSIVLSMIRADFPYGVPPAEGKQQRSSPVATQLHDP